MSKLAVAKMSGAVPPIPPVTGGAIYEATAKAEKAYADADQLADVEYTELQKMTGSANQAELTKVMGRTVSQIRPSQQNMLFHFNSHATLREEIAHAITTDPTTLFSDEEQEDNKTVTAERLVELTMLRRRQLVFTSMADAMTDDIGQWLNRIKSAGIS